MSQVSLQTQNLVLIMVFLWHKQNHCYYFLHEVCKIYEVAEKSIRTFELFLKHNECTLIICVHLCLLFQMAMKEIFYIEKFATKSSILICDPCFLYTTRQFCFSRNAFHFCRNIVEKVVKLPASEWTCSWTCFSEMSI